jgi:hypothetical protein
MDALALMSFPGVLLDECPRRGGPHDVDIDVRFLRDDDE